MIGSSITKALVMVLGYAYTAYECYKVVEKNKPEIEQLRFWCQYWILVAVLVVCERIGDAFISWVPMYSEAKLLFFIFLWCPKTKLVGTTDKAGDIAVLYWRRAAIYGQTRTDDILQFLAAQSTPSPRPAQRSAPGGRVRRPASTNRQPAAATQTQDEEPPSPTSSISSTQLQKEVQEELASPKVPKAASLASLASLLIADLNNQKANFKTSVAVLVTHKSNPIPETTNQSASTEAEPKQNAAAASKSSAANENGNLPTKDSIMAPGRIKKNQINSNPVVQQCCQFFSLK
ncbi:hypothetical protein Lal_00010018 [Lupinus albus]|uniref:HVA22-like protein n=1 Tax=Lupinus albus TaxID=3870 RepID=A0A6A4NBS6_LUPAL|nr:hypothetical protein Lalb_Chr24g0398731 [Lupinus albus]KAF1859434.1 hypothetical protein Lal_00010018 [Lupinus albus]